MGECEEVVEVERVRKRRGGKREWVLESDELCKPARLLYCGVYLHRIYCSVNCTPHDVALIAHRLYDSGLATVSKCQPVNVREGSAQLTSAGLVQ